MGRRGVSARRLRSWLAELPEFEERETWGSATFRVRAKMFGVMDVEGTHASFKASREEQAALLEADPTTYDVPSYVGRHGWVGVTLGRADPDELREIAVEAWRRTAPRRVVAAWEQGQRQDGAET